MFFSFHMFALSECLLQQQKNSHQGLGIRFLWAHQCRRVRGRTLSVALPLHLLTRFSAETTVYDSCTPSLGLYDRSELFTVCGFEPPCFDGRSPYRKTRGTTAETLRDDTFHLCGSFQQAWLKSAQFSSSHCVWLNMARHTRRTRSVGTNDRVLKVSAVQAPYRIDPRAGFFLHAITKRVDDHESTTPFTRHVGVLLAFVARILVPSNGGRDRFN